MAVLIATREYTLIYVFSVPYEDHAGLLKIGKASVSVPEEYIPEPNNPKMQEAANARIKQELNTGGFKYNLLYTELAYYKNEEGKGRYFDDHDVHAVLQNSGYRKHVFDESTADEWYSVDLDTVKTAIKAVKEERQSLEAPAHSIPPEEIQFREEQNDAVRRTLTHFQYGDKMLWNAKMRFGKTLCALEVVRQMKCKRTLILTHRPAVRDGWFEDFGKIKFENYQRGTKPRHDGSIPKSGFGQDFKTLERDLTKDGKNYIYFISMQDLRGSKDTGGKFNKNSEIFSAPWDLIILDEAHEGTQTRLGKNVIKQLERKSPKFLYLSGTPFNILNQFDGQEIYTWDYVKEQEAKETWNEEHPGEKNPYEGLPRLNMLTYSLGTAFEHYKHAEDDYFNFKEFFRVWKGNEEDGEEMPTNAIVGDFVHKEDVLQFLDLLTKDDPDSNYPFANEVFRHYFEHTFWVVPGVKAAAALTQMLCNHPVFKDYKIVNVAGDGHTLAATDVDVEDDEDETLDDVEKKEAEIKAALAKVKKAIAENERTITISCGRLTTGVTVPEWTAVFMLAGSYSTKAATYMQTIFRVQSPATDGTIKRECYAFDFAPDRTVTVVEDFLNVTRKLDEGKSGEEATEKEKGHHDDVHARYIKKFMHYCPIIAVEGSKTETFDTLSFMKRVNRAIADQIYRHGFNSHHLFMGFDEVSKEDLEKLTGIESLFGNANNRAMSNEGKINVNEQGLTGGDGSSVEETEGNAGNNGALKKNQPKKPSKPRNNYAESLRRYRQLMGSIAKRFPLLLFGAIDSTEHWSLVDFVRDMDKEDWEQFMPKGFTQEKFLEVSHLFNNDFFLTSTQLLLEDTHSADDLSVEERVKKMAHILQHFHYPDKETVLTPWRVVNLHMTSTIGGYSFFKDSNFTKEIDEDPILQEQGSITKEVFAQDSKLLEINSKSGVYPLWLAYTLFRYRCAEQNKELTDEQKLQIWDQVLSKQLFVLCKTEMAKRITQRVLGGYRKVATLCKHEKDLLAILKDKERKEKLIKRLKKYSYWGIENMITNKFNFKAVVGNPPYQADNHWQLYPDFYILSRSIGKYSSLIFPTGWQAPKNANNLKLLNTEEIKTDPQIVKIDNRHNIFPGVSGAEWVNIVFWEAQYNNGLEGNQLILTDGKNPVAQKLVWLTEEIEKPNEIKELVRLIKEKEGEKFTPMQTIMSASKPYGLRKDAFGNWSKYKIQPMREEKKNKHDIAVYGKNGTIMYAPNNYKLPRTTGARNNYKVFVATAWGNMSEDKYLGGAYSDIILAGPNEICTETYQESGNFKDKETCVKHAKYLLTKFARAALYCKKISQMTTQVWGDVPVQDYSESWWNESIEKINEHLMDKYNIPQNVRDFVNKNIQPRTEENIRNL